MSDGVTLDEALADKSMLGSYQELPVLKTSIKLTKAGDGLSKSLGIDPQLLPIGATGMLLVGYKVESHGHKLIKDVDAFELIQTLEATTVTIVDDQGSARKIEKQRRKLEEAEALRQNKPKLVNQDGTKMDVDGDIAERPEHEWDDDDPNKPDLSAFNGDDPEGDASE